VSKPRKATVRDLDRALKATYRGGEMAEAEVARVEGIALNMLRAALDQRKDSPPGSDREIFDMILAHRFQGQPK